MKAERDIDDQGLGPAQRRWARATFLALRTDWTADGILGALRLEQASAVSRRTACATSTHRPGSMRGRLCSIHASLALEVQGNS